jgi:hypothetical protein
MALLDVGGAKRSFNGLAVDNLPGKADAGSQKYFILPGLILPIKL